MQRTHSNEHHELSAAALGELVHAFRSGDRLAFTYWYNQYERSVYRFCRHMLADDTLARDAFQESFIRFFEHRRELNTDNVKSWLFTIVRRTCLNMLRSQHRTLEEFNERYHSVNIEPTGDVFLREHIDRALQQLPLALRESIVLRDVEGYSYQEIATIVGIDLSLAKVRVYRARLHMRKLLMPIVMEQSR